MRCVLKPLYVDTVQKFNTAQRESIQAMGFGRFLELQTKVFPTELSYALLNNYNPMNSKLTLKDGLMAKDGEKLLYPALIKAMLDRKDGDVWFKRLFMVLTFLV
nr:peptidase S10, serine carboxypeptidase, Alpha/Beta hydrolase fold protein [Ipomoea batatas]